MKIAVVGTLWIDTPPKKYGGTEAVVFTLINGLVRNGHDVTFFGPGNAKVKGNIVPTVEKPLLETGIDFNNSASINYHLNHFLEVFRRAEEFDVIHIHLNKAQDFLSLPLAVHSKTPVMFTLHFPAPTATYRPDKYLVLNQFKYFPFTSISNAARSENDWNFIATVYNSIDLKLFPFSNATEDYFAWIGKAIPIKGLKEAIMVAKKAGVELRIMAAVEKKDAKAMKYFNEECKPLMDGKQIVFLGEADLAMKTAVLGKAKAFINPIQWPEPFGLVMAESQAVGTPVIALNKGAAPELVVNGKTGFVVNTLDEMVEKVKQIDTIHREACREHVKDTFSPEAMVKGYEQAYETATKHWVSIKRNKKRP